MRLKIERLIFHFFVMPEIVSTTRAKSEEENATKPTGEKADQLFCLLIALRIVVCMPCDLLAIIRRYSS